MLRVAAYLRISEDRAGDQLGVDRQREDIERFWQGRDARIVEWFIDNDVSATSRRPRPAFEEMMQRVSAGEFDVVTARHMDRLLRKLSDFVAVYETCKATQCAIVTTADGVDTRTDGGKLVATIFAAVAEQEVERKAFRTRSAFKQRASMGHWTGGQRPFGYEKDGVTIIDEEARWVRHAYESIIRGDSLYYIAATLNDKGVKTANGNEWKTRVLRAMLLNPRYAGLRTYHGEIVAEAEWPPIIDRDTYEAARAILTDPARRTQSGTKAQYLLSGILKCHRCNEPMYSHWKWYPDGQDKVHCYRCLKCFHSRKSEPVDQAVTRLVLAFLASDKARDILARNRGVDIAHLRQRETILIERLDQLAVDYASGMLNGRQLKVATERLEKELKEVQAELVAHTREGAFSDLIRPDPKKVWDKLPLDRRRLVISELAEWRLVQIPRHNRVFKPERHLIVNWLIGEE